MAADDAGRELARGEVRLANIASPNVLGRDSVTAPAPRSSSLAPCTSCAPWQVWHGASGRPRRPPCGPARQSESAAAWQVPHGTVVRASAGCGISPGIGWHRRHGTFACTERESTARFTNSESGL